MNDSLATTPLYDWHVSHGARVVDFAGWMMPVQYSSIVAEHHATRNEVGLFDISHMGRVFLSGPGVPDFLERVLTRSTAKMGVGRIRYSLVCNESGGILDDVLIYRLTDAEYLLVVNAGNRSKIVTWLQQQAPPDGVSIADRTTETAMIAVQGPKSESVCQSVTDFAVGEQKYYTGCQATIGGEPGIVSRTGYTGEDGWELIVPAEIATGVWETLLQQPLSTGGHPAAVGLGARDTLRLEAAMPLYGHELSEEINPVEADLGFAFNLDGREFIGRDAIAEIVESGVDRKRVGLGLLGRRIAREDYPIVCDDQQVGVVTSGTLSPTLERPIAMGYVPPGLAEIGRRVAVEIRGRLEDAEVVALPFYKRKK